MNKILKTTFLSLFCLVLLAACGKKEDTTKPADTANIGDIVNQTPGVGLEFADCPGNYDPVCTTDTKLTYKNACHAEKAGENAWQPGEC